MDCFNRCTVVVAMICLSALILESRASTAGPDSLLCRKSEIRAIPHTLIIKLRSTVPHAGNACVTGITSIDDQLHRIGATSIVPFLNSAKNKQCLSSDDKIGVNRIMKVTYSMDADPAVLASELAANPAVEYAEPYYMFPLMAVPNDSLFSQQWALASMHMPEAWDITTGSENVVIGDIDTGIDFMHEDLTGAIWSNPQECGPDSLGNDKRTNGIDDDGNGKIDDWHGWDFIGSGSQSAPNPDNDPSDGLSGHGTMTAGCVSATTNNRIGIAGTSWKSKVLPVKVVLDRDVAGYILAGYEGIMYAVDMGCKVINCSWGGTGVLSKALRDIIGYAYSKGALVIAAAGNDGRSNDTEPHWPASYEHVLSVGAIGPSGTPVYFSTFGRTIDVYAPGVSVLTTKADGSYATADGTSFAAPLTAGVAALLFTLHPDWSPDQVAKQIRVTTDPFSTTRDPLYYGKVNAVRALSLNKTMSDIPGVEIISTLVKTDDGTSFTHAGQTGTIEIELQNLLAPTSNAAVLKIKSADSILSIDESTIALGALSTGEKRVITLHATCANTIRSEADVLVHISVADGSYADDVFTQVKVWYTPAWHTSTSIGVPLFSDVSMVGSGEAWIVGGIDLSTRSRYDVCYRTLDGGETWQSITGNGFPSALGLTLIDALNSDMVVIVSRVNYISPGISFTTDAGKTWTPSILNNVYYDICWIHMFDERNGIAGGNANDGSWGMIRTTDGAASWSRAPNPMIRAGAFDSLNRARDFIGSTGWFATESGMIYRTDDAGWSWNEYAIPKSHAADLSFRNGQVGAAWFIADQSGGISGPALTTDGGATWKPITTVSEAEGRMFMERGGNRMWLLCDGNVYVSTDLGLSWTIQPRPNGFRPILAKDGYSSNDTTTILALSQWVCYKYSDRFEPATGVEASGTRRASATALRVFPQPASGGCVQVDFDLPQVSSCTMSIFDNSGRMVHTVLNATLTGGLHSMNVSVRNLPAGVYYMRLDTGNSVSSGKFVVD